MQTLSRQVRAAAQQIADSILLPRIPHREFPVEVRSGDEICAILNDAIARCAAAGGGKVIVPPGSFRCGGAVVMQSGVELHLSCGCFLKFSPDPSLYLPQVFTRWEGTELYNYSPFIYGKDLHDVAISGKGVIAGGVEIFQRWLDVQKAGQKKSRLMQNEGIPVEKRFCTEEDHLRPSLIQFVNCERVKLSDFTATEAPFWMVHPLYCRDVTVCGIHLDSMFINNDGIDVDSCCRVLIENSHFRNGDDAVVIKSGRDQDGLRVARPTTQIIIRDCVFHEALHGFAIGSELSGGANEIYVLNVKMEKIFRQAISFKSMQGRGGVIEKIFLDHVSVDSAGDHLVCFDNNYKNDTSGAELTVFRDVVLNDIQCTYAKNAFFLQGKSEMPLGKIELNDVTVRSAERIYSCDEYASQVCFDNVSVNGTTISR